MMEWPFACWLSGMVFVYPVLIIVSLFVFVDKLSCWITAKLVLKSNKMYVLISAHRQLLLLLLQSLHQTHLQNKLRHPLKRLHLWKRSPKQSLVMLLLPLKVNKLLSSLDILDRMLSVILLIAIPSVRL